MGMTEVYNKIKNRLTVLMSLLHKGFCNLGSFQLCQNMNNHSSVEYNQSFPWQDPLTNGSSVAIENKLNNIQVLSSWDFYLSLQISFLVIKAFRHFSISANRFDQTLCIVGVFKNQPDKIKDKLFGINSDKKM